MSILRNGEIYLFSSGIRLELLDNKKSNTIVPRILNVWILSQLTINKIREQTTKEG